MRLSVRDCGDWGFVFLGAQPILAFEKEGEHGEHSSIDHVVCYIEREMPFSGDAYEEISQVRARSDEERLMKIAAILRQHTDCPITVGEAE